MGLAEIGGLMFVSRPEKAVLGSVGVSKEVCATELRMDAEGPLHC